MDNVFKLAEFVSLYVSGCACMHVCIHVCMHAYLYMFECVLVNVPVYECVNKQAVVC